MWPFRRTAPARFVPGLPYIGGESWAALGGTASSITPQQAEALAAVLASVNAIACTVASLPAYVTKSNDAREEAPDHPLQRLIDLGVSDDESWSDFIEGLLASCLLRGNFLAEIDTDARGRLTGLRTLPWQNVTAWVNDNGGLLFDFIPTLPPNAGKRRRYLREDVLFVKDRSDDGVIGRSRISRAALSLQSALTLETSSRQFLTNAARPSGALTAPGKISEATARRLAEDWDSNYNGERKGKTALLPEGLTRDLNLCARGIDDEYFNRILLEQENEKRLRTGLITAFIKSNSFIEAKDRFIRMESVVSDLSDEESDEIVAGFYSNSQLFNAGYLTSHHARLQKFLAKATHWPVQISGRVITVQNPNRRRHDD